MNYQIHSNVPMPPRNNAGELTKVILSMQIGDMFLIPASDMPYVKAYQKVKGIAARYGLQLHCRPLDDGCGVWMGGSRVIIRAASEAPHGR